MHLQSLCPTHGQSKSLLRHSSWERRWKHFADAARWISKLVTYGVGEFRTVQLDAGHTRITYSFKFKGDQFSGELGAMDPWLFRVYFLDPEYADMMKDVLIGYQHEAEARPAIPR